MDSTRVYKLLKQHFSRYWGNVLVPEYTFGNLRIDAILIDTHHRWIRGFEIKTTHSDFLQDKKWQYYSEFVSSLCIVCPKDLIKKEEVPKPFGLIYVSESIPFVSYINNPKNFQKREALAWKNLYLSVIEREFIRINEELKRRK
jgi:hypothetical protein